MPHRSCSNNIKGSAVFYLKDGELCELTKGASLPLGTTVVAVPYGETVNLPDINDILDGNLGDGEWVFNVGLDARVSFTASDIITSGTGDYPRDTHQELLGALRKQVPGGIQQRNRDVIPYIASDLDVLVNYYKPDPSIPVGVRIECDTYDSAADLEHDLWKHSRGVDSEVILELSSRLTLLKSAAHFNVPLDVAVRAADRTFEPATTKEDIVGPSIPVQGLYYVTMVTSDFNDSYGYIADNRFDSVWASEEEAQARALELEVVNGLAGGVHVRVNFSGGPGVCEDSAGFVVYGHKLDSWNDSPPSVVHYVEGVYATESEARHAMASLGNIDETDFIAPSYGKAAAIAALDTEKNSQSWAFDLGEPIQASQVVLSSESPLANIEGSMAGTALLGMPRGSLGVVRVNQDDYLRELGADLVT